MKTIKQTGAMTCEEASDLVSPPLYTEHEHAGDRQAHEVPPFLQAFCSPACRG